MTLPAPHVLGLNLDPQTRCDHYHGPTDIIAIKTKCCGEFYELDEEWGCSVRSDRSEFLGMFTAPAANESGCLVEAALYRVELVGTINAASEIEEVIWLDPNLPHQIDLAPLTKDCVAVRGVALGGCLENLVCVFGVDGGHVGSVGSVQQAGL